MQLTVDTREDSLEKVLAVIANAYGVPLSLISGDVDLTGPTGRTTAKVIGAGTGTRVEQTAGNRSSTTAAKTQAGAKRIPVRRHANVAPRGQARKIREWARDQGYLIGDAGRLPADVIAEYRASHKR